MKKIKCLDCDQEFMSETKEEVMKEMHPHYMKDHQDIMKNGNEESKKEWFDRFNKDWENAPEV